jgi:MFS family permease
MIGVRRGFGAGRSLATWAAGTSRAVLAAAVLGTALAYMSDDMLNLAVPSMARDLGATMTDVQWILNSYYVTLVAFVLVAGSIGDIIGHRRVANPLAPLPLLAVATALVAGAVFVLVERHAADPMLPMRFFRRRAFLGGNLIWLLGAMTSWGAVFFLAISLQTTLGLRPLVAGLVLVPIYLVMMAGSPLAGRLAERVGPRRPILAGLGVYAFGLWMLSSIGPTSAVVPDVLLGVGVTAIGMATFTAPLAAVTMGSLDDADQGIASGVNNAMGQLAGLLAVVILPAVAGLGGVSFGEPAFASGYATALRATAVIAAAAIAVAAVTLRPRPAEPVADT